MKTFPVPQFDYDTWPTPAGEFSAAVNAAGAVTGTAFGDVAALQDRLPGATLTRDPRRLHAVGRQVAEYFAARRRTFDLPLAPAGSAFQQQVWEALRRIDFGTTASYGELAAALGRPGAARAVGRANATNPLCLLVPCHRVIGRDGSLTGFAFGSALKAWLLRFENPAGAPAAA